MPLEKSFGIPPVSNYSVHKFLSSLDKISPKYLKLSANVVSSNIVNQSILSGIFPSRWKESKITPLHKGGEPGDLNSYRPISILNNRIHLIKRTVRVEVGKNFCRRGVVKHLNNRTPQ